MVLPGSVGLTALPSPLQCRPSYNQSLAASLGSKLFFVDRIPAMQDVTLWFDFGCGDGALLKALHTAHPGASFVGYDIDRWQVDTANAENPWGHFLSSWDYAKGYLSAWTQGPKVAIFSSVLHEVWSNGGDLMALWREVEALGFDYIVVRDMALPRRTYWEPTPERWLEASKRLLASHLERDFERTYGPLGVLSHFMHFLLKYPYRADWERELAEDYTRYSQERLIEKLTRGPYSVLHARGTSTRHFRDRVWADLGIFSDIPTHLELVLERTAT